MFIAMLVIFLILFRLRKALFFFGFFFKLFSIVVIVIIAGSILFAYLVIQDANNFRMNFANSSNMFIMKENINGTDVFLTGISLNIHNRSFVPMSEESVAEAQRLYAAGKIGTLSKDYYKIFVVDMESLDNVSLYNISDKNVQLTKDEIKRILESKNAREEFAAITAGKQHTDMDTVLSNLKVSDEELKGYLFSYYISTIFDPKNMGEFLIQLQNDNIKVYDDTMMFRAIKFVPVSLVEKMIN